MRTKLGDCICASLRKFAVPLDTERERKLERAGAIGSPNLGNWWSITCLATGFWSGYKVSGRQDLHQQVSNDLSTPSVLHPCGLFLEAFLCVHNGCWGLLKLGGELLPIYFVLHPCGLFLEAFLHVHNSCWGLLKLGGKLLRIPRWCLSRIPSCTWCPWWGAWCLSLIIHNLERWIELGMVSTRFKYCEAYKQSFKVRHNTYRILWVIIIYPLSDHKSFPVFWT